jgi:hypothetical protein
LPKRRNSQNRLETRHRKTSRESSTKKTSTDGSHIDDGFWQGAPVVGFGAEAFSRTLRGDLARWEVQTDIHN